MDDNEGRREKEKAQDAVTGVIINRVLGQNSVHTQGREVTLLNVVTTEKQFTTLENEQGNNQSYIAKGEYEWPGWEHAVENAYWVAEILGNIDGNSTQRELDEARKKLEEKIGASAVQNYENYRTTKKFESDVQVKMENGIEVRYWGNKKIISYYNDGDHVYFNTN